MDFDKIFEYIIAHPKNYPGPHLDSQVRNNEAYKPLEPKAQFHLVLKALSAYIKEKLQSGKGVMMKNFGAFTFEVISNTIKPAQHCTFDTGKTVMENRADRKHIHKIRPCFLVQGEFEAALQRFPNKREIDAPQSQHSVYQQGSNMLFCNPRPIALGCKFSEEVTKKCLEALTHAVVDLTRLGKDLRLDFGFCCLKVNNKDLKYHFDDYLTKEVNNPSYEYELRKSDRPTPDFWKSNAANKFKKTELGTMLPDRKGEIEREQYQKTLALKIMSLDMNTTENANFNKK